MTLSLTSRQRDVLEVIRKHTLATGQAPSFREAALLLGIRSTNGVADHVKALRRKGYLRDVQSGPVVFRGLRLTPAGRVELGLVDPIAAALAALHGSP